MKKMIFTSLILCMPIISSAYCPQEKAEQKVESIARDSNDTISNFKINSLASDLTGEKIVTVMYSLTAAGEILGSSYSVDMVGYAKVDSACKVVDFIEMNLSL